MDETAHFMDETAHFMDENVTFQSYGSKGHFMDETAKLMGKKKYQPENSTYSVRTSGQKYVLCLYEYTLIQIQLTLHFRHHHPCGHH
jgi:hypothetical protein